MGRVEEQTLTIPKDAWTLDGFRNWATSDEFPQRGRISFIHGEIIIDMSPEELSAHNPVKTEVSYGVVHLNKRLRRGKFFSDRTLVTNVAAELSTEPDGTFVTYASFRAGRVHMRARKDERGRYMELEGSPDWILEVVSNSSVRKDTQLLRAKYPHAGVSEYWLIDARGKKIDFQILLHEPAGYVPAPKYGGWQRSRVFGRSFRLSRRRDAIGSWEYTLHVKPE
jgi:Uma2 family endonuclease